MTRKKSSEAKTQLPFFQSPYNMLETPGEINDLPSATVPDLSMSIPEILLRHTQGRPIPVTKGLSYGGEEYYPNVKKMDLTEAQEAIQANAERLARLQEEVQEKRKKRSEQVKAKRDRIENVLSKFEEAQIVDDTNSSKKSNMSKNNEA